ncbi:hypothetical protein ACFYZI_21035 [Streptomyces griseorubiginosus]|uniref:hypothetical protein n=1 Tax=Streptomyces griseorubiginosus TaxID=67304 RepID=UPI00363E156A
MRLLAEQVAAEPPAAGADGAGAEAVGVGREAAGVEGAEGVEELETDPAGFDPSGVEEAAELPDPDAVGPPSAVSAPLPPGWHPATARATEATTTAIAEPRIPFTYRMLSPGFRLSEERLRAALVDPDRSTDPAVLRHFDL